MKDIIFVLYRLENEVCDDSFVDIIGVFTDVKKA